MENAKRKIMNIETIIFPFCPKIFNFPFSILHYLNHPSITESFNIIV